jgi:hypothetical protein
MPEIETAELLARAAQHEAGHAVAALHYRLPLLEVVIRDDGSGNTSYCRNLGLPEAEDWCVTTFCGGEAEHDRFHDRRGDHGDLLAITNMLAKLKLDWSERRLAELRHQARHLVKRERSRIRTVAAALLRHRRLSAFDVKWLKACSVPRPMRM